MKDLTVIFPFFDNVGMLREQQRVWEDYSDSVRSRLQIIIVDDCSPKGHRLTWDDITSGRCSVPDLPIRLFRITKKVRWNWLACRNRGAEEAETQWLLLTDIDHVVPPDTMKAIMERDDDPMRAFRFKRVTAPSLWPFDVESAPAYKPHNDSWLLTKQLFWSKGVGGYDERLSGCYGTSSEFTDRVMRSSSSVTLLNLPLIRYPREVIPDASTHPSVYTRKGDDKNDDELMRRKNKREAQNPKGWRPLHHLIPCVELLPDGSVLDVNA